VRIPYAHYCITVIKACQEVFLCYSIFVNIRVSIGLVFLVAFAGYVAHKPNETAAQHENPTVNDGVTALTSQSNSSSDSKNNTSQEKVWNANTSAEWPLFWVGVITVAVLIAQANEMRKTTEAMWTGQRAHLAIDINANPLEDLLSKHPRIRLNLVNKGLTPAYDCVYESWIEILPRDCEDFTPRAEYFKAPNAIPVFPDAPIMLRIPFPNGLPESQLHEIKNAKKTGYVRVRAEYRDARNSTRYIDFGFRVEIDGISPMRKYSSAN
jgi:hypothetical protein